MSKYLLPCECGKGIAVDVKQAGQQIACECGKLLEVPTLRGVRALQPAREIESSSRKTSEWNASRGMIFAGSLILLVIGGAVSFFGYDGLRSTPDISREVEMKSFDQSIDDMSLDETYETWKQVREHGLGVRGQNMFVNIRTYRAGRQRMLTIGLALCIVGSLGAIGSMLGRRKTAA
ncbi:MAG: hypothetical protein HYV60_03865 [Planctomycetia bacterium]|nr:hypothetical protein [Planctomycetia bacterium]